MTFFVVVVVRFKLQTLYISFIIHVNRVNVTRTPIRYLVSMSFVLTIYSIDDP